MEASNLTQFFWKCAGVDPQEVQHWKSHQQRKYAVFGWFVVMSGLVASISGFLAFVTVFKSAIGAIFFAIFFGLIVFNLYRFIIVNIGYRLGLGRNKREQFMSALPRVYMALIMGFVISKPLELFIFSPLISQYSVEYGDELYQKQVELIDIKFSDIEEYKAKQAKLDSTILLKQNAVHTLTNRLSDSTVVSNETLISELSRQLVIAKQELATTQLNAGKEIQELEQVIQERQILKDQALEQSRSKVNNSFSLLNQITVLHEKIPKTWFFTTLVILFYVLPIIGKIKFSSDDYALVYYLNSKGEWLGNKFRSNPKEVANLQEATPQQEELTAPEAGTSEETETPKKPRPKLGFMRITILVVGLIILVGELNQRNIFTDMLSVMLVLTAILGWMKIIEREIAAIAMVFFTLVGSFAIFLMATGHPMLGVLLGCIVLLTFGILLIGSVLPIMQFLYTLGIFLFLVIAISFTIHSMLRDGQNPPKKEKQTIEKVEGHRPSLIQAPSIF